MKRTVFFMILLFLLNTLCLAAHAKPVGKFSKVEGRVDITSPGASARPVHTGDEVSVGDIIRVKSKSKAEIIFGDGGIIRIAQKSRVKIDEYIMEEERKKGIFNLFRGKIENVLKKTGSFFGFKKKNKLEVHTPTAVCGVRGTDFFSTYQRGISNFVFKEGQGYGYSKNRPDNVMNINTGQAMMVIKPDLPPIVRVATAKEIATHSADTAIKEEEGRDEEKKGDKKIDEGPDDKKRDDKEPGKDEEKDRKPGDDEPEDKGPGDDKQRNKEPGDDDHGDDKRGDDRGPGDDRRGDRGPGDDRRGDDGPGDYGPRDNYRPGDDRRGDNGPKDYGPGGPPRGDYGPEGPPPGEYRGEGPPPPGEYGPGGPPPGDYRAGDYGPGGPPQGDYGPEGPPQGDYGPWGPPPSGDYWGEGPPPPGDYGPEGPPQGDYGPWGPPPPGDFYAGDFGPGDFYAGDFGPGDYWGKPIEGYWGPDIAYDIDDYLIQPFSVDNIGISGNSGDSHFSLSMSGVYNQTPPFAYMYEDIRGALSGSLKSGYFFGFTACSWKYTPQTVDGIAAFFYIDSGDKSGGLFMGEVSGSYSTDLHNWNASGSLDWVELGSGLTDPGSVAGITDYPRDIFIVSGSGSGNFYDAGSDIGDFNIYKSDGIFDSIQKDQNWGFWQTYTGSTYSISGNLVDCDDWFLEWEQKGWETTDPDEILNLRLYMSAKGTIPYYKNVVGDVAGGWVDIDDAVTGIAVGELHGGYDPYSNEIFAGSGGVWLETKDFLTMVGANTAGLDKLNIPRFEIGKATLTQVGLSDLQKLTNVKMTDVTFFAYTDGSADPRIWATNAVSGNYVDSPLGDIATLSGNGLSATVKIKQWNSTPDKWAGAVSGSGTYTGADSMNNTAITFKGGAAGDIDTGAGTLSGTAAGWAK